MGKGDVILNGIKLHNVAYVPDVKFNLFSISTATKFSGHKFIFDSNSSRVVDSNGKVSFFCKQRKGLYVFKNVDPNNTDTSLFSTEHSSRTTDMLPIEHNSSKEEILMHARLGHPGTAAFNALATAMNFKQMDETKFTKCPTCSLSKAVVHKGKTSTTAYTAPLELIQIDLCGPFSYDNYSSDKYFMVIRDAYTRYYSVIHLASKGEASTKLINWIIKTENWFSSRGSYKVVHVRSDNGSEFINKQLKNFFDSRGIIHQLTVPYNSFQNGAAERANRTIEDKARALMIGGKVPPFLWVEAISCAVYLINRLPIVSREGKVPWCLWNDVPTNMLNLDHLKIFGCQAYVTVPQNLRDGKLTATGMKGVFVGYDEHRRAYRIFDPNLKKIFSSNQVVFDEKVFPLERFNYQVDVHQYSTSPVGGVSKQQDRYNQEINNDDATYDDDQVGDVFSSSLNTSDHSFSPDELQTTSSNDHSDRVINRDHIGANGNNFNSDDATSKVDNMILEDGIAVSTPFEEEFKEFCKDTNLTINELAHKVNKVLAFIEEKNLTDMTDTTDNDEIAGVPEVSSLDMVLSNNNDSPVTSRDILLVQELTNKIKNQDRIIQMLSKSAPQVKHRSHVVDDGLTGTDISDLSGAKAVKKEKC